MHPARTAGDFLLQSRLLHQKLRRPQADPHRGQTTAAATVSAAMRSGMPCSCLANARILLHRTSATAATTTPARDGISCAPSEAKDVRESLPLWAQTYEFTGSLRPCLMSPIRPVRAGIRKPDYADHPQGVSLEEQESRGQQIHVYTENELRAPDDPTGLRHACRMGREVLDAASRAWNGTSTRRR
jgi:hypothetical protein